MKNPIVMTAIAHEIDSLWRTISHPNNTQQKVVALVRQYGPQIRDLHDAYFEIRGNSGIVWNVAGLDTEAQRVKKTYNTVIDMMCEEA